MNSSYGIIYNMNKMLYECWYITRIALINFVVCICLVANECYFNSGQKEQVVEW